MKKKVIAAVLLSAMLMSACNTATATESTAPETEAVTTTTVEETTTETTTEATSEVTTASEEEMLDMTIEEVVQAILDATGEEYFIFVDDADSWRTTINLSEGIENYMTCGYIGRLEDDEMVDGYNTIYITFEVFEFDTESEQYKSVCETGKFVISRGEDPIVKKHAVVNKQYALIAFGALCNDDEYALGKDPAELYPPYTIGKTQQGYDAFVNLK